MCRNNKWIVQKKFEMVDEPYETRMNQTKENISNRPSSQISNDDLCEDIISSEQKMLPGNTEALKNINSVQKVDNGRNLHGYRFVKVSNNIR